MNGILPPIKTADAQLSYNPQHGAITLSSSPAILKDEERESECIVLEKFTAETGQPIYPITNINRFDRQQDLHTMGGWYQQSFIPKMVDVRFEICGGKPKKVNTNQGSRTWIQSEHHLIAV